MHDLTLNTFVTGGMSCFTMSERLDLVDVFNVCDPWLTPEDVWTTANDVRRRAPSPCGGSPARAFVMAHQRARCHRSQESARIGLAGGRGAQDIQSPYRVVSRTPMKAVMVTSMGEGDRAVRGRPFTLRGNCAARPHVENYYSFFNCVNRQLCLVHLLIHS